MKVRRWSKRERMMSLGMAVLILVIASLGVVWATTFLRERRGRDHPGPERRPTETVVPLVTARLSFDGAGAFDIEAGNGRIWVAAHGGRETFRTRLVEVDPARSRVVETGVKLGGSTVPAEIEMGEGALWIRADELNRIDPRRNAIVNRTVVPGAGLAAEHGAIWTSSVARIDPADGRVEEMIHEAAGDIIVADRRSVWVGNYSGPARVSRLDPWSNAVIETTSRPGFYFDDVTSDGRDAWIAWSSKANGPVSVTESVPGSSGRIEDSVELPDVEVVSDMIFAAGRLWVVGFGTGAAHLYQIDPERNALVGEALELGGTVLSVTATRNALWVADLDRPMVTRVQLITTETAEHCREPLLHADPASAPIGARVELRGKCFTDRFWRQLEDSGSGIFLLGHVDGEGYPVRKEWKVRCEVIAAGAGRFDITPDGRLRGHFIVPTGGDCFQASIEMPIRPGRYRIGIGCHTCTLAPFRVADVAAYVSKNCGYSEDDGHRAHPVDGRSPGDAVTELIDRWRRAGDPPASRLVSVEGEYSGVLSIDFKDLDPFGSVGTSCGSSGFMSSLTRTAFQFPEINIVIFRLNGDCDAFWETLESVCRGKGLFRGAITRAQWEKAHD